MILDTLRHADRYDRFYPGFKKAFAWLRRAKVDRMAPGKYPIVGKRIYAVVVKGPSKGPAAKLEIHRKYLDIQVVLKGHDLIGYKPTVGCRRPDGAFDAARDLGFFKDKPDVCLPVPAGSFAVFFPDDAHAPMAGKGRVEKVVLKIKVRSK